MVALQIESLHMDPHKILAPRIDSQKVAELHGIPSTDEMDDKTRRFIQHRYAEYVYCKWREEFDD